MGSYKSYIVDALNELDVLDEEVDDSEMYEPSPFISEKQKVFADMFRDMVQKMIYDGEDDELVSENFKNKSKTKNHYKRHCIDNDVNKKSKRSSVYYDFNHVNDYSQYENKISSDINSSKSFRIKTLNRVSDVEKAFRKFAQGNSYVLFTYNCGFVSSDGGDVEVGFHSFANNNTTNYSGGNTVYFIVIDSMGVTKTLYPLDINYVESKFNNLIKYWNNKFSGKFSINH